MARAAYYMENIQIMAEQKAKPGRLAGGLKKHRFNLQVVALVTALSMPFALYGALEAGNTGLAVACFTALAASLALVILVG